MFKIRLPKRGQILLIGAGLLMGLIPLLGTLDSGNIPSASAASSSGSSVSEAVSQNNIVEAANRRKKTPRPFTTPTVTPSPTPGSSTDPLPVGQTGNWRLVFRDEFNNNALDTSKWSAAWDNITGIYGPVNGAETACYDSSNVIFPGDGSLHLQLESKQAFCKGASRPYSGALIHSNTKYQFTYGYYEVRAFLPAASNGTIANWPAVWSDGQNWPVDGENDTMEGLSGKACYHFHYAIDSNTAGDIGACANGTFTGWHVFASDWEPGSITYYYDGIQVGQITTGITSSPHYMILDYTQGSWGGLTSVPAEMQIDYARIWQH